MIQKIIYFIGVILFSNYSVTTIPSKDSTLDLRIPVSSVTDIPCLSVEQLRYTRKAEQKKEEEAKVSRSRT